MLGVGQLAMAVSWIGGLYRYVRSPNVFQSDFTAFYTAWRITIEGRSHDLYNLAVQQQVQEQIRSVHLTTTTLLVYVNPPFTTLAFTPLGWLPFRAAYLTWLILQLFVLAAAVRSLLCDLAADWTPPERLMLVVSVVTCVATMTSLSLGAFAIVALLAGVKLTSAVTTGKTRHGGIWLALLCIKPQLAILVVVALVGLRCWVILREATIVLVVASSISTVVSGPSVWGQWITLLRSISTAEAQFGVDAHYMWNLRGALVRLGQFSIATNNQIATAVLIISVAAVFLTSIRARHRLTMATHATVGPGIAALIGLSVLTATHCNRQDTVVLMLACALTYNHFRATRRGAIVGCVLMAVWLVAWLTTNAYNAPVIHPVTALAASLVIIWVYLRRTSVQATVTSSRSDLVNAKLSGTVTLGGMHL